MMDQSAERLAARLVLLAGLILGAGWFVYFYSAGLTTAHYDAKAHLLVARRVLDSTSPGYLQLGAHWLPFLHLLYLPLVVFDSQYRTGLFPSLISVCAFALSGWLLYRIALRCSGSWRSGVLASAILLANANWQYLQACPLTEPLFLLLNLAAVDRFLAWRDNPGAGLPWTSAVWAALAALCRYEGWFFVAGVIVVLAVDAHRGGIPRQRAIRAGLVFAGVFALPVVAHFGYVYVWTRETFFHRVARGYPTPYVTHRRPLLSVVFHLAELVQVSAVIPLAMGIGGVVFTLRRRERLIRWLPLFLLWLPSALNVAALYWGLIYRVRYSCLVVPAVAAFAGVLCLSPRALQRTFTAAVLVVSALPALPWFLPHEWRFHMFTAAPGVLILPLLAVLLFLVAQARSNWVWESLVLCVAGMQLPVLYAEYRPLLVETREHSYIEAERQAVLDYLRANYDGARILVDIGRQAPLVYDSAIPVRKFIYNEGQQREWVAALMDPRQEAGWIVMEKGDELWNLQQVDPRWADMYALAVQTDSYRLYRLQEAQQGGSLPARRFE
jgi:hypothetical protein